jgi:hypothetical protein
MHYGFDETMQDIEKGFKGMVTSFFETHLTDERSTKHEKKVNI